MKRLIEQETLVITNKDETDAGGNPISKGQSELGSATSVYLDISGGGCNESLPELGDSYISPVNTKEDLEDGGTTTYAKITCRSISRTYVPYMDEDEDENTVGARVWVPRYTVSFSSANLEDYYHTYISGFNSGTEVMGVQAPKDWVWLDYENDTDGTPTKYVTGTSSADKNKIDGAQETDQRLYKHVTRISFAVTKKVSDAKLQTCFNDYNKIAGRINKAAFSLTKAAGANVDYTFDQGTVLCVSSKQDLKQTVDGTYRFTVFFDYKNIPEISSTAGHDWQYLWRRIVSGDNVEGDKGSFWAAPIRKIMNDTGAVTGVEYLYPYDDSYTIQEFINYDYSDEGEITP